MTRQADIRTSSDLRNRDHRLPQHASALPRRSGHGSADEQSWLVQSMFGPLLRQVHRVAD